MRIMFIALFMSTVIGCGESSDSTKNTKLTAEEGVEAMNFDISMRKKEFERKRDSFYTGKIQDRDQEGLQIFIREFSKSADFLDSLRTKVLEFETLESVKEIFIGRGLGDTIYSKISESFELAESFPLDNPSSQKIQRLRDSILFLPSSGEWSNEFFTIASPYAASMILFGIEMEFYQLGIWVIEGYRQEN